MLSYNKAARSLLVCRGDEQFHVAYAHLYRGVRALAPFLADARFAASGSSTVDDVAIVRGELRFLRGFVTDAPSPDPKPDYWHARYLDRPRDQALRQFVAPAHRGREGSRGPLRPARRPHARPGLRGPPRDGPPRARPRARARRPELADLGAARPARARCRRPCRGEALLHAPAGARPVVVVELRPRGLMQLACGQEVSAREHLERAIADAPGPHRRAAARRVPGRPRAGDPRAARGHLAALGSAIVACLASDFAVYGELRKRAGGHTLEPGRADRRDRPP